MPSRSLAARLACIALASCCIAAIAQTAPRPLYLDPSRPINERVTNLIGRLTLDEKAELLNHTNTGIPRLDIPLWGGWNQTLHGVWSKEPTTLFPAPIAMGATWDPALVHSIADAMSDEARALYNSGAEGPRTRHGLVYRSPVINLARDPRWGRIQEIFSEDPYLTGEMGVAYVKGLQGDDPNHLKLAATIKHYAVYNVENGRQHGNAVVDDRNLMEYWLAQWKIVVTQSHPQSLMSSYNAVNGTPDAVNHFLLTDVLRNQWGFDGFVTDDLGAVALLTGSRKGSQEVGQRLTEDPVLATAMAIKAGNDSDDAEFQTNIPLAVQRGLLTTADVDRALRRVLRVGFRLGVFDPPADQPYRNISMSVVRSPQRIALAQGCRGVHHAAQQSPELPPSQAGRSPFHRRHRSRRRRRLRDRQLLRQALPKDQSLRRHPPVPRQVRPRRIRAGNRLYRRRRHRSHPARRRPRPQVRRRHPLPRHQPQGRSRRS